MRLNADHNPTQHTLLANKNNAPFRAIPSFKRQGTYRLEENQGKSVVLGLEGANQVECKVQVWFVG
jgi:hypothetical protein